MKAFICESGSHLNLTGNFSLFVDFDPTTPTVDIMGIGSTLQSEGSGTVLMDVMTDEGVQSVKIENVLYIPNFEFNLLGLHPLLENSSDNRCFHLARDDSYIGLGDQRLHLKRRHLF